METIKSYTDIEQSKKLAKILPIESADMFLALNGNVPVMSKYIDDGLVTAVDAAIPCWSLVALEGLMPFHIIENNNRFGFYQVKGFNRQGETYCFGYKTNNDYFLFETSWYNDIIDAAFEMVVWLKENNKI